MAALRPPTGSVARTTSRRPVAAIGSEIPVFLALVVGLRSALQRRPVASHTAAAECWLGRPLGVSVLWRPIKEELFRSGPPLLYGFVLGGFVAALEPGGGVRVLAALFGGLAVTAMFSALGLEPLVFQVSPAQVP